MLVTGSTGVGKSTQIPKLLMYSLKMLDHKEDGKIACTVPRTPVAVTNAATISKQMGIPIFDYNQSLKSTIDSANYNVQFQYMGKKHAKPTNDLTLKIVTDGLLLQEIIRNPLLKMQNKMNKNVYDIVIVDEAHEHNKNMDYILTLMKYALYFNNSLRLVIISATMDDDEPIYRRFYRDINDNRLHPFNQLLPAHNLDRINVDRRLHISPPGATTQYKIDDVYRPGADPEALVLEIATKTHDGDILLFKPGVGEISGAIEILNKTLPSNFIALPFYSELNSEKRAIIENLSDVVKKKITHPRTIPFDKPIDQTLIKPVPEGTYTRVVIVATNLAEASLTINTLKYVVDTGTEKSAVYDYKSRDSVLKSTPISESSRLQRRGRVGRVGPGTVYYLYEQGSHEGIKKSFNISVSNLYEDMMSMLRDNSTDQPLFTLENDPNRQLVNSTNLEQNFPIYHLLIKQQYFYKDEQFTYYGDDNCYDYNNTVPPSTVYQTGQSKTTLEDSNGSFYIIHPDELYLVRNIGGTIVGLAKDSYGVKYEQATHSVTSYKINSFWDLLFEKLCIYKTNDVAKTEFGKKLLLIKTKMYDLTLDSIVSYLYGRKYGVDKELLKIMAFISTSSGSITSFSYQDPKTFKYEIDYLKTKYANCISDSHGVIQLADSILNYFVSLGIINTQHSLYTNKDVDILMRYKSEYLNAKKSNQFDSLNKSIVEKFIALDHSSRLDYSSKLNNQELTDLTQDNAILTIIKTNLYAKQNEINRWCYANHLQPKTITSFINKYVRLTNDFMKYTLDNVDGIKWFDTVLKISNVPKDLDIRITSSFLHGNGYKIAKKIDGTNLYVQILNPSPNNIYEIGRITKKSAITNTFLKNECYGDYVMYLSLNVEKQQLFMIHNVQPNLIQSLVPYIYKPELFLTAGYDTNRATESINYLMNQFKLSDTTLLKQNMITNYTNSIKSIKRDMLNSFNRTVYYNLLSIDNSPEFKHSIEQFLNDQLNIKRTGQRNNYNEIHSGGGLQNPYYFDTKQLAINNLYAKYIFDHLVYKA
jgi:hypothetical protein